MGVKPPGSLEGTLLGQWELLPLSDPSLHHISHPANCFLLPWEAFVLWQRKPNIRNLLYKGMNKGMVYALHRLFHSSHSAELLKVISNRIRFQKNIFSPRNCLLYCKCELPPPLHCAEGLFIFIGLDVKIRQTCVQISALP